MFVWCNPKMDGELCLVNIEALWHHALEASRTVARVLHDKVVPKRCFG